MSGCSDTWLCVGAGPSAETGLTRSRRDWPGATTVGTNSAAMLLRPDFYFLSDHVACRRWGVVAKAYQALGTKLLTLKRSPEALKHRGVDDFDLFFEAPDFCYSGLFCVIWAARQAKRVCLVGHDGYRSTPEKLYVDYFDGRLGARQQALQTHELLRPRFQAVAEAFPAVEFVQYCQPLFKVEAPNWLIKP